MKKMFERGMKGAGFGGVIGGTAGVVSGAAEDMQDRKRK